MNGPRFQYVARLAPINKTVTTRVAGEGLKDIRLDEFCLALALRHPERTMIRISHEDGDVGRLNGLVASGGWYVAGFELDPDLISDTTENRIRPGFPLSIGFDVIRSEVHPDSRIETVREAALTEVSLCRTAMIDGARIVSKGELRPARRAVAAKANTSMDHATEGEIILGGAMIRRPGIGQVIGVR